MPKESHILMRLTKIEAAVAQHLMESGEIRTDIAWIKRGVYGCVAAAVASTGSLIVGIILALIKTIH